MGHGHLSSAQVKATVAQWATDADGHRVEYGPAFHAQRYRVGGDMMEVPAEACEMVEDGLIAADECRDFVFANVVRLYGAQNPGFFVGTRVANAAAEALAAQRAPERAAAE